MCKFVVTSLVLMFSVCKTCAVIPSSDLMCINLDDCPFMVNLLKQKPVPKFAYEFLKKSNCGYSTFGPKVWCRKTLDDCTTPDKQQGVCTKIKSCGYVLERIAHLDLNDGTAKTYLKEFECVNIYDNDLAVCCPQYTNVAPNALLLNSTERPIFQQFASGIPSTFGDLPVFDASSPQKPSPHVEQPPIFDVSLTQRPSVPAFGTNVPQIPNIPETQNVPQIPNIPDRQAIPETPQISAIAQQGIDITSNLVLYTSPHLGITTPLPVLIQEPPGLLPSPVSKKCGQQRSSNRIIGGQQADLDEFPWLAILQYRTSSGLEAKCGGTLINNRYVVTAAHCVDSEQVQKVVLGDYDTRNTTDCIYEPDYTDCADPVQIKGVEKIILHPDWISSERKFYNDIALVRLQDEVKFTDFVKPICLPPVTFNSNTHTNYTVAGWGRTETEKRSPLKRKVDILVVEREYCSDIYKNKLSDSQMCLGSSNRDSCSGDSGFPMMKAVADNQVMAWYAVGLVSLGYNNPCGFFPGVYTYLPPYVEWIKNNLEA